MSRPRRYRTVFLAVVLATAFGAASRAAWEPGTRFAAGETGGKPCLLDPRGRPFKSVGMVWAYGPERGPKSGDLTVERLTNELQVIKDLGFNTLNLYGDRFIPEMLEWCDRNELAVYFRTAYYSLADFPGDLKEYPDYMDPAFREAAKDYYRKKYLDAIKDHPSVLAIDMDHRWLFQLDWGGAKRFDQPKLRPKAVAFFPRWLEAKYGQVEVLNAAWGTSYRTFDDILKDGKLIRDGEVLKLGNHPARVDAFLYTLWTASDFLKELAGFLQSEIPGLLITPTTEHPECIPDANPRTDTGIAFMSPVHYNGQDDFERDLPGLCKLIYETRWHYDLQGGPVYISETGFRTDTLEQKPPATMYAWTVPPDEETAARCYALEFSLLNVLPWISGYGYFMLYDKWAEGDFGYLRDDGTKKPMAIVGDAINRAFSAAALPDPEPQVWVYYPDYAQATHRPGFQQIKSLVAILEQPFLRALEGRVDEHWEGLRAGDPRAGRRFAAAVTKDFRKLWRGFAFATSLPHDGKPVILLSTISEILTPDDRDALRGHRTITIGPVGVRDRAMRETEPWNLEALGLGREIAQERFLRITPRDGTAVVFKGLPAFATNSPWPSIPQAELASGVPCRGQGIAVPAGRYTRLELLAGSVDGDAAPFFEAVYAGGVSRRHAFAPTVSDTRFDPVMTEGVPVGDRKLSRVVVSLEPSEELQRIVLPDAPWVQVHGLVLARGGEAREVRVALPVRDGSVTGITTWWLCPNELGEEIRVLKQFAGGEPAVIARGAHAAFLFDPLTWSDRKGEISQYVDLLHHEWFEPVFEYLRKARTP